MGRRVVGLLDLVVEGGLLEEQLGRWHHSERGGREGREGGDMLLSL